MLAGDTGRREIWPKFMEDMPKWNGGLDYRKNRNIFLRVLDIGDTVSLALTLSLLQSLIMRS